MNDKIIILSICLMLTACVPAKPPRGYDISKSQASLAEASYAISRSIVELAESAQAAHPLPALSPPPNPATYGLGGMTTIDWSGPVGPLLRQIAKAVDYRVRILGRPPAIPVMVTVLEKQAMIGDIIRDIGYQCGTRAAVVVYPESRVIELRYARN